MQVFESLVGEVEQLSRAVLSEPSSGQRGTLLSLALGEHARWAR